MIPTEQEYTAATHAAAQAVWAQQRATMRPEGFILPEWDDLPVADKRPVLEAVLPIVNAAISAIPDRSLAAWERGYIDHYFQSRGGELPTPAARYDIVRHLLDHPGDDGELELEKWNPYR